MSKYAWEKYESGWERGEKGAWVPDWETARKRWLETRLDNGVIRWTSNNAIPFEDALRQFRDAGFVFDFEKSCRAREEEAAEFIRQYAERRKKTCYSDEEIAEMRAAFGPGETVVDVFTGAAIKL